MISSIFKNGFSQDLIVQYLLLIPIVLFSLSLHEFCHGYVAYLCGDPTARNMGRLTLNPLKHLDPIGAIMMLLIGFGWAIPVPVNSRNFKKFKRDLSLVALAGPVSNIILAFISVALMFISGKIIGAGLVYKEGYIFFTNNISNLGQLVLTFFYMAALMNIGLAVFNLIPLPPLDGSKIIISILPRKLLNSYLNVEKYSRFIFLALIISSYVPLRIGGFSNLSDLFFFPIQWLREGILNSFIWLFSLFM